MAENEGADDNKKKIVDQPEVAENEEADDNKKKIVDQLEVPENEGADDNKKKIDDQLEVAENEGADYNKKKIDDQLEVAENEGADYNKKKIVDQLEYYFGDYNLPRDKFFSQQIALDDGWIPLDLVLKCQRLAKLADSTDAVIKALEEIKSTLLELSEDKKKIRRDPSKPVPVPNEEQQQETMSRTVYCKGFPQDETLDNIRDHFLQFGKICSVHMRNYKDKKVNPHKMIFKGSVFIVFEKLEEAEAFMKLESAKYKETELIRKWQKDYNEEKRLERLEKFSKGKKKNKEAGEDDKEPEPVVLPTGCYLQVSGSFGDTSREAIRAAIQEQCDVKVAFIDFNRGDPDAWVRLQGQGSSAKAVEKTEGKLKLGEDLEVTMKALTEEEEKPYYEKAQKFLTNFKHKKSSGFRKGGKRPRRGGGGRGGRHQPKRAKLDTGNGD